MIKYCVIPILPDNKTDARQSDSIVKKKRVEIRRIPLLIVTGLSRGSGRTGSMTRRLM